MMNTHDQRRPARRREHFVPLTKAALIQLLSKSIESPQRRGRFAELCRLLEATLHYEFHARLEQLYQAYEPANPDSDKLPAADAGGSRDDFFPRLKELVKHANYHELSRREIEAAVNTATAWGVLLKVDFDRFDELEVFARGDDIERQTHRHWRNWFRPREVEVPVYRRLLIAFRLREDCRLDSGEVADAIYIKLFKNIPHTDMDKLLPGGEVAMTWWDRARIFAPTVTGLAVTAYKISKGALILAFAGLYGMLAFVGLVGGTVGYGMRSFYGYLRAKEKYRLNLTQNLYYQNLDNNAGVLFRLLYDAEEQEFCEAALAYFILWHESGGRPQTLPELDEATEAILAGHGCGHVDFEASDALEKLRRWGLVEKADGQHYQVVPIDEALAKLDAAWDGYFHHRAAAPPIEPTEEVSR